MDAGVGVGVEVEEIDIVIVGAGICGLAKALALQKFLLLSVYVCWLRM